MGRTVPTFRQLIEEATQRWTKFRRALRREDQEYFDRLFRCVRSYTQAATYQCSDNPMELGRGGRDVLQDLHAYRAGGLLIAGEDPTGYGGDLLGFGDQREVDRCWAPAVQGIDFSRKQRYSPKAFSFGVQSMAIPSQGRQPSPDFFYDTLHAYRRTAALTAAIEFDLFKRHTKRAQKRWNQLLPVVVNARVNRVFCSSS